MPTLEELIAKLQAIIEDYKKWRAANPLPQPPTFDENPLLLKFKKMYNELSPKLKPIFQNLADMLKAGKFAPKSDILQKMDELEADVEEMLNLWQQINSEIMLSACWAGTDSHKNALKDLSAKFNGASIYGQKSVGIGVGLFTQKTFTMIPRKIVRKKGEMMHYFTPEDALNAGLWTKAAAKTDEYGDVVVENGEIVTEVSDLETLIKIQKDGDVVESNEHFNRKFKNRLEKIADKIPAQLKEWEEKQQKEKK